MAALKRTLDALLPFTNPATPIWQDVIHTLVLFTFLWFAPKIDWTDWRGRVLGSRHEQDNEAEEVVEAQSQPHIVIDEAEGEIDGQQFDQVDGAPDQPTEAVFPPPNFENGHGHDDAGPADPYQPPRRVANNSREVGAKKAKSLARRNQQRAYNEFLREQGEAERAEWARDATEREEKLEEERAKRVAREQNIKEKERKEREVRKVKEEEERREELDAIRDGGEVLREGLEVDGFVRCEDLAKKVQRDVAWVEGLVKRYGVLGIREVNGKKEVTMLTARGFVVRVNEDLMKMAYERAAIKSAKGDVKITWNDFGSVIQKVVTERHA